MSYLVDTDWLIDALNGISGTIDQLEALSPDGLAVSIVTIGEIYEGAFLFSNPEHRLEVYRHFLNEFAVLPLTDRIVETFARNRSMLRQQGRLIPDFDLLIASTALTLDLTLMTNNTRHFERIPALKIYDPDL